jgi:nitrate reductase beta subunit
VDHALRRLAAMRSYMRGINLDDERDERIAGAVGMTGTEMEEMYRLLAIAKYEDRYVIPAAHTERAHELEEMACSLDYEDGPGMGGAGPFGSSSGRPVPVAVENFHALQNRQTADRPSTDGRVNLLNWDGNGSPDGLFPPEGGNGEGGDR